MKPSVIIIIAILSIQYVNALEYDINGTALQRNARDMALGGMVCTLEDEPYRSLECTYLMPFMLKELSIRSIRFHTEGLGLGWTIGGTQSGNTDWMESIGRIHLDKRLSDILHIGAEFDFLWQQDVTGQNAWALFPQVDCWYVLTEKYAIGATLLNPAGASINTALGKVPMCIAAFLAGRCKPVANCSIFGEIGGWTNQRIMGHMGMEYVLNESFILRTGFSSNPLIPSWGIGGKVKKFQYSLCGNIHPLLGLSNGFSLQYIW